MSNSSGGMFGKLINPETGQAKAPAQQQQGAAVPQPVSAPLPTSSQPQSRSGKRKQISAYLTQDQLALLKQLHFTLNTSEATIEKSEIIGLGIELVAHMLRTHVPKYSNIDDLRKYLDTQVSKYLDTRAP
jgi:hypothetical protein